LFKIGRKYRIRKKDNFGGGKWEKNKLEHLLEKEKITIKFPALGISMNFIHRIN